MLVGSCRLDTLYASRMHAYRFTTDPRTVPHIHTFLQILEIPTVSNPLPIIHVDLLHEVSQWLQFATFQFRCHTQHSFRA